nr:diagnostic antigen gp50 [Hymenolepis microstoma]
MPNDVIITINDTAQFKSLSVAGGKRRCIATFVPKCEFKPVKSGALIPQAAFPFAKFVEGERSVNITFSVKGLNSTSKVRLYMNSFLQCIWYGMIIDNYWRQENCLNLTENSAKDQLDGTVVYERVNSEETTDFEIVNEKSKIQISVFWEEKGPSPDIAECQKATTSEACAIGFLFSVLLGITQWMFN